MEGGNQSGKTWTGCIDFLLDALGLHPSRHWYGLDPYAEIWIKSYEQGPGAFQSAGLHRIHLDEECNEKIYQEIQVRGVAVPKGGPWRGWYCTVSYELFAEQGWNHFKRLLLFPGESVLKLPTRRILEVGWDKKNPERPTYLKLRRAG